MSLVPVEVARSTRLAAVKNSSQILVLLLKGPVV
jgi:hypothetical protein